MKSADSSYSSAGLCITCSFNTCNLAVRVDNVLISHPLESVGPATSLTEYILMTITSVFVCLFFVF